MTLAPGSTLAAYAIERLLGRGGMGEVYLATHAGLGRKVALKVLAPELAADPAFRERFIAESRLASSLDHPHIVPIYEAGETDGKLFIAMRYVDGDDLGGLIAAGGAIEPVRAVDLLAGIGAALDAAHDRGLVHRDVKPANILVARTARADEHAYLGDFGLTKLLGSDAGFTRSGQLVGSVDYVAPEQIEGRPIDSRVDVYSLACVLYTALTGQPPYRRETDVATLWAHVQAAPPRPSDHDPGLARYDPVIARGMAKDPTDRQPTAGELMRDASEALGIAETAKARAGAAQATAVETGRRSGRSWSRNRIGLLVAGAAAVLVAVVAIGYSRLGGMGSNPTSPSAPGSADGPAVGASGSASKAGQIVFVRRPVRFDDLATDAICLNSASLAGGTVRAITDDGTNERSLTTSPMDVLYQPALSPDGTVIAYFEQTNSSAPRLAFVPLNGGPIQVAPTSGASFVSEGRISWSPDSSQVAFVGFEPRDGTTAVIIAEADGSNAHEVWRPPAPAGRISAPTSATATGLPDTSAPPIVGETLVEIVTALDWMPDGRLAIHLTSRFEDDGGGIGEPQSRRLLAIEPDGRNAAPIVSPLKSVFGEFDISPDSRRITFTGEDSDIYTMNLDGTDVHQLTSGASLDLDPVWSPSGERIAFSSQRPGAYPEIYTMDAEGGSATQVTHGSGRRASCSPSWGLPNAPVPVAPPSPKGDSTDPRALELGDLMGGTYSAAPFDPGFQITLPEGWEGWNVSPDALYLVRTATPRVRIQATRVQVVFDGHCLDSPTKLIGPAPLDLIAWLQANPDLETSQLRPISAGGATGIHVEVVVKRVPGDECEFLGNKTWLYPMSVDQFALELDDVAQFVVLDAHGTRVVLTVFGPRKDLGAVSSETEAIFDSVRFP